MASSCCDQVLLALKRISLFRDCNSSHQPPGAQPFPLPLGRMVFMQTIATFCPGGIRVEDHGALGRSV
jgi:hypothetical protein